jgi:hypothetical protein
LHSGVFPISAGAHTVSQADDKSVLLAGEQHNLWLLKKQRDEVSEQRAHQRELALNELEQRKYDIVKQRQVSEVMKHVLKVEQEANMMMYHKFNREEKELMTDIRLENLEKLQSQQQNKIQAIRAH